MSPLPATFAELTLPCWARRLAQVLSDFTPDPRPWDWQVDGL